MHRQSIFLKSLLMAALSLVASEFMTRAHAEPAIHLVVVGDTLDPKIGGSVAVDMQNIIETFSGQVRKGDRLKIVTVKSSECRPDLILRRIAALRPEPLDAVVVYFSGHGAFDNQEDQYFKFPRLGPQGLLTRRQVREAIRAQGTRLGVLITDCCNNMSIIPRLPRAPTFGAPMAPEPPLYSPLFRSLFLETRGFIDVTSSKKGERSLAYPATRFVGEKRIDPQGGLFTTSFQNVLVRHQQESLEWSVVVTMTSDLVRKEFERLKPDGLDNEDQPENPQMTQTVFASELGLRETVHKLNPVDPDRPEGHLIDPDAPGFGEDWTLGVLGYENRGRGIVVWASLPGSPAARLGLEYGDQVLRINDTTIRTARGYHHLVADSGGIVELAFRDVRTGKVRSATMKLESEPRRNQAIPDKDELGATGEAIEGQGIRVVAIAKGSPAALLGLDPGDVITDINGKPVRTMDEYHRAVRSSTGEMWFTVLNVRTGKPLGTVVQLDRFEPGRANFTFGVHASETQGGLYIWGTRPGGPAARLGLERGDVILSINGAATATVESYRSAIQSSTGIIDVTFRDVRTGQVRADKVTLDRGAPARNQPRVRPSLGVQTEDLPARGIKIVAIVPNSPAANLALDPGDIVTHINGRFVDKLADFRQAIESSHDEMAFTLINVRTGQSQGMLVQLDR
jgi:S1-C subfamily serine protease